MKLNILSWIILSLSVIGICSCQDEELLSAPGNYSLNSVTRAAEETTSDSLYRKTDIGKLMVEFL